MSLSARQTLCYTHRGDLWAPHDPIVGSPGERSYSANSLGQAYYLRPKSSVDDVSDVGLMESTDMMTTDEAHLQEASPADTNWILFDITADPDGALGENALEAWIVRGSPVHTITSVERRPAGKCVVYLQRLPTNALPANIKSYYGLT